MKRTIKFRGRTEDGKWHIGDIATDSDGDMLISTPDKWPTVNSLWDVDANTIGQYTGFNDCNGIEIYDGDIVELLVPVKDGYLTATFLVEWFSDRFILRCDDRFSRAVCGLRSLSDCLYPPEKASRCKVIGNEHDNPELVAHNYGR